MTTIAYTYDPSSQQFIGAIACLEGTCPPNATLTPLPGSAKAGDVYIWQGQWVKKADGVSLISGYPESAYVPMTPYAFMQRFTQPERVAIRTLAQNDMNAADFMAMLNSAQEVILNDPTVAAGVGYCASKIPAITAQRVADIMNPTK